MEKGIALKDNPFPDLESEDSAQQKYPEGQLQLKTNSRTIRLAGFESESGKHCHFSLKHACSP
jgi:hypothetical protein